MRNPFLGKRNPLKYFTNFGLSKAIAECNSNKNLEIMGKKLSPKNGNVGHFDKDIKVNLWQLP